METILLKDLLKYLGLGGGGAGVILAAIFVWGYLKIKDNTKRVDRVEKRCNGQDEMLAGHSITLGRIEGKVEHVEEGQKATSKKIDKLIELHMNGGRDK